VVAATNQNLEKMVQERRFRADLFYRLNVFPIMLPPLRERSEDIPQLVRHFVKKLAPRMNSEIDHIPSEVMEALQRRDWPGNIRELQNCIERAMIMSSGRELQIPSGELKHVVKSSSPEAVQTLADAEREHIQNVLQQAGWMVGGRDGAAARLGLARTTLIYKMRKLGIAHGRAAMATA
jgi:formate hydrogenlyase transcriptional activator